MIVVVSLVFRVIKFPHEGQIVTIDQLSFCRPNPATETGPSVSLVGNSMQASESIGVGLYPTLMGTFHLSTPVSFIESSQVFVISHVATDHAAVEASFQTSYF
jgi:hypothetical protein